ncbi:MAG: FMN-binding protein [Clostridiales bacterium]|nr:FMN-binding protein [Clostridiales bacterium]
MSGKNESRSDYIKEVLKTALILLTICACSALLISVVRYITLNPKNGDEPNAVDLAILELFSTSSGSEKLEGDYANEVLGVYKVMSEETVLGYCVNVNPQGYNAPIEMVVGIDDAGAVVGVKIISHSETRRIGDRVEDVEYLSQYVGKKGSLSADDDIDMISGATVSSKAVLSGVNIALSAVSTGEGELS